MINRNIITPEYMLISSTFHHFVSKICLLTHTILLYQVLRWSTFEAGVIRIRHATMANDDTATSTPETLVGRLK